MRVISSNSRRLYPPRIKNSALSASGVPHRIAWFLNLNPSPSETIARKNPVGSSKIESRPGPTVRLFIMWFP